MNFVIEIPEWVAISVAMFAGCHIPLSIVAMIVKRANTRACEDNTAARDGLIEAYRTSVVATEGLMRATKEVLKVHVEMLKVER